MKIGTALLTVFLLGVSGFAWAEGGCPSGMIPYRGTDISSCGPIPAGYYSDSDSDDDVPQSVASPARWMTTWGAIAADAASASLGTVVGMPSEQEARRAALAQCRAKGGEKCEVDLAYHNQCAVMILGSKTYNTASAQTIERATLLGMKTCNADDTNCRVYYSDCSLARRTQ
jgi:hypothetical protein